MNNVHKKIGFSKIQNERKLKKKMNADTNTSLKR